MEISILSISGSAIKESGRITEELQKKFVEAFAEIIHKSNQETQSN